MVLSSTAAAHLACIPPESHLRFLCFISSCSPTALLKSIHPEQLTPSLQGDNDVRTEFLGPQSGHRSRGVSPGAFGAGGCWAGLGWAGLRFCPAPPRRRSGHSRHSRSSASEVDGGIECRNQPGDSSAGASMHGQLYHYRCGCLSFISTDSTRLSSSSSFSSSSPRRCGRRSTLAALSPRSLETQRAGLIQPRRSDQNGVRRLFCLWTRSVSLLLSLLLSILVPSQPTSLRPHAQSRRITASEG